MHLALTGLFRAKWSAGVHEEWISNLLRNRPGLTRDKLERTRMLMDKNAVDALVTGYEDLISGLQLPDPDDRHVLAAAILGQANVIVTMNLRDFPPGVLAPFGIEAQHPDEFVLHLLDLSPGAVLAAAQDHRRSLKNPPKTLDRVPASGARNGILSTCSLIGAAVPQMVTDFGCGCDCA